MHFIPKQNPNPHTFISPPNPRIHLLLRSQKRDSFLLQRDKSSSLSATMSVDEIACTYACLILHDDGIPITADKISTLVNSAGVKVQAYWPGLFVKLLQKKNVDDLILNVGSGGGGAPVGFSAPAAGGVVAVTDAPPVEEKKEEPKEESDDDMGFSLFD